MPEDVIVNPIYGEFTFICAISENPIIQKPSKSVPKIELEMPKLLVSIVVLKRWNIKKLN